MGFLTDVTDQTRRRLADEPLDAGLLLTRAQMMSPPRDLVAALRSSAPAIIAEVKRASPSGGAISPEAAPVAQAASYVDGGAAVVSVLTDPVHFDGSLVDLQ